MTLDFNCKNNTELNMCGSQVNLFNGIGLTKGTGAESVVQKDGGVLDADGTPLNTKVEGDPHFYDAKAIGISSAAFGVNTFAGADTAFAVGFGAKALEKGCVAFGNAVAGKTSDEWIAYYYDTVNNTVLNGGSGLLAVPTNVTNFDNQGIIEQDGVKYYVLGPSNTKYANYLLNASFAAGQGAKAKGFCSIAMNYMTESLAKCGYAGGYYAKNYSQYGFTFGNRTETSQTREGQVVFGKYNIVNDNAVFQIGQGTKEANRKNIFEIIYDGRVKAYGTPTEDNDVIRLKELDALKNQKASSSKLGLVKIASYNGISIAENGLINIVHALESEIDNRDKTNADGGKTYRFKPITPADIDYAVMKSLSAPKNIVWTNEDKAAARITLGVNCADVQVNGVSVVSNGIADIPLSINGQFGVSKTYSGYGIKTGNSGSTKGYLLLVKATNDQIDKRTDNYAPIVSSSLDYATMKALTDSKNHTWTEEEKALACGTLGAVEKTTAYNKNGLYGFNSQGEKIYNLEQVPYAHYPASFTPLDSSIGDSFNQNAKGTIIVNDPSKPYHAANKKYVDANKGTQLYKHIMIFDKTTDDADETIVKSFSELTVISTQSEPYANAWDAIRPQDFTPLTKLIIFTGGDLEADGMTIIEPFPEKVYMFNRCGFSFDYDGGFYPIGVDAEGNTAELTDIIRDNTISVPYSPIKL